MRRLLIYFLAVISLCLLLFSIYWNGLLGAFFFDDQSNILAEAGVRLDALSFDALREVLAHGSAGPSGRPVARLSFALNYYFSGFDPFAFKLTNLAIHAATAYLIYLLASRLFLSPKMAGGNQQARLWSAGLAIIWAVHPIQLLPVLHVVQRMTSLSAFFLLAATLSHIRGRQNQGKDSVFWLALAWLVFWPLSFLSKETGALFPAFIFAWECLIKRVQAGGLDRFARWFVFASVCSMLFLMLYMFSPFGAWLWAGYGFRDFTLAERLMTEGRVIWFYLELIIFPRLEAFGLFHDDIVISVGLFEPWTTSLSLAGLFGILYLVWWFRNRQPLIAFGIAWFLIGHGIESTALPLEIAHEHRNYLPSFGILLAIIGSMQITFKKAGTSKTLALSLMVVMLAYFPLVTALRAHEFGDEVRRSQVEAQHHRQSARAQHEAGRILAVLVDKDAKDSPAYGMAKVHFELAGELDRNFKMNWLGLIHLNCLVGRSVERVWLDELRHRLAETPFAPGDRTVLHSLKDMAIDGSICLGRSDIDSLFAAALHNPGVSGAVRAMLNSWYADYLWLHEHDLPAARVALEASLALIPGNSSNRLKWAQLVLLGGETEKARRLLQELRSEHFSPAERKTLDELLLQTGMLANRLEQNTIEQ